MGDIRFLAAGEIINAYDLRTPGGQHIAHPGPQESCAACDQNPLALEGDVPEVLLYCFHFRFIVPSHEDPLYCYVMLLLSICKQLTEKCLEFSCELFPFQAQLDA